MLRKALRLALSLRLALLVFSLQDSFAASLPASTLEILKKLKIEPSLLADIDRELAIPREWTEKAKKEGKLRVLVPFDPDEVKVLFAPFRERYPFIAMESSRGSREDRVKILVAYKSGRIITDVLPTLGGSFYMFKEANALEDLTSLPNQKSVLKQARDAGGLWVGIQLNHWCIAYNTKLVGKEDLPQRWDDLLANPRWRGGRIALGNRPNLWLLHLWNAKGETWAKDFVQRLFNELKPQLRKEDMSAMLGLLAAGEFDAVIPALEASTYKEVLNGAPLGFTCPEPVPVGVAEMGILRGSPNLNAARIFVNWFLSKEGQIAQYASTYTPPAHKDLRRREFIPFSEQILGRELAFREPGLETELLPRVMEFWNGLWNRGGRGR